ncbi:type I-E CRISPR-associated endoribonuclease Cas2e [Nocardiopsis sp. NPDC006938]|uniref:type I-E CRISPR-associated endoribonuclease Cas2e n=1 Tax=Nocardiopsis sp. NPDC006938 TaxID=3364337 RepID=UPI00369F7CEB
MTVIVLAKCPKGPRGFLSRWLMEISSGVFIGNPSRRVREALWAEVQEYANNGRALLAYGNDSEQGFSFETFDHAWEPKDHEGLVLMHRPKESRARRNPASPKTGWSKASKRRRFGKH